MARKQRGLSITELSEKLKPVIETLSEETHRGAALVGAAYLDDLLAALLRTVFIEKCADELLGRERPLGTFYARICLAYSIGLLDEDDYNDLHIVRDIRNAFAHLYDDLSFESESVRAKCDKMHLGQLAETVRDSMGLRTTDKERFAASVALLGKSLVSTARTAKRATPANEFYAGFFSRRRGS